MLTKLAQDDKTALIVVDQQLDFEPGGSLEVQGGDEILPEITHWMRRFSRVVVTQDSHPARHISFASSYSARKPFDVLTYAEVEARSSISPHFSQNEILAYLSRVPERRQVLWPDHCVVGTPGWEIDPRLPLECADLMIRKGTKRTCDSYSTFFENDGTPTGLAGYLKDCGVQRLVLSGLAGDYCVLWSARDARRLGFEVIFVESLTRFVDFPLGSQASALRELNELKSA